MNLNNTLLSKSSQMVAYVAACTNEREREEDTGEAWRSSKGTWPKYKQRGHQNTTTTKNRRKTTTRQNMALNDYNFEQFDNFWIFAQLS